MQTTNFFLRPFATIFTYRKMIRAVFVSDLCARYAAGNKLGWLWLIFYPLSLLGIYTLLFLGLSGRSFGPGTLDYVLLVIAGFIAWMGISEMIAIGITLVHANANILRNTVFPVEILSIRMNNVALAQLLISFGLLLIAYAFLGKISIAWVQFPLILAIHYIGCVGLTWILATLGAFFKDLSQLVSVLLMVLLMITPAGYTEEMISGPLAIINKYNLFTYILRAYRLALCQGQWLDLSFYLIMSAVALALFYLGYFAFMRLKPLFSDLV